MAPLHYAAKFDPFLSLDCVPKPSTLAQSKERKRSNFAIWQPWYQYVYDDGYDYAPNPTYVYPGQVYYAQGAPYNYGDYPDQGMFWTDHAYGHDHGGSRGNKCCAY